MALSFFDFYAANKAPVIDPWLTAINGQSPETSAAFNLIVQAESYFLTANPTNANETDNNTVMIDLATQNVAEGTVLNYSIAGAGIETADFVGLADLTGVFTVGADGTASITLTIAADALTEGTETFTLSLDNGMATSSVTIADTSTGAPAGGTINVGPPSANYDAGTVDELFTFIIASGTYTATIANFDAGDVMDFFDAAVLNVTPDVDDTDGAQSLTAGDAATGNFTTIALTGLTNAQDAGLFNIPSIDTVFGAGTIL